MMPPITATACRDRTGTVVGSSSPDLTWTGEPGPGRGATVTFSVTVSSPDTGNQVLASTVTSATAGSNCPAGGGAIRGCAVTVRGGAAGDRGHLGVWRRRRRGRWSGSRRRSPMPGRSPIPGSRCPTDASGVFANATPNGDQTATSGAMHGRRPTGAVTWTGDIPVGGTVTMTGTVTVNNPDTGNKIADGACSPPPRRAATARRPAAAIPCCIERPVLVPAPDDHPDGEHHRRRCPASR